MALIVCKNCGKSISDTTKKCIHCGHPVNMQDEIIEKAVEEETVDDPYADYPIFHELPAPDRKRLEREFLSTDRWAMKYRRGSEEITKYGKLGVLAIIMMIITRFLLKEFVNVNDPVGIENLAIACNYIINAILYGCFAMIVYLIVRTNKSRNRAVYDKRFQKWLREVKEINYVPNFSTESDRFVFEQTDVDDIN